MEKRSLGKTGMQVTVLGFGAAEIGFRSIPTDVVGRLLNSALDAGLNVIDTAECYIESEVSIGETVAARRDEYFLFTKCGHEKDGDNWNPKKMALQVDHSLRRLKTDRVDLLQLHSCSEAMLRQGDVIDVLTRARDAGKTRFIGYSGDGSAAMHAVDCGLFDTLQISVNIADQESIDHAIPAARAKGMGIIAKRPIANAIWKQTSKPDPYYQVYWERLAALDYEFLKDDFQSAISTALRFTLAVPGVTTAIVGTAQPDRWAKNAEHLKAGPLEPAQWHTIRSRWQTVAAPDWEGQT